MRNELSRLIAVGLVSASLVVTSGCAGSDLYGARTQQTTPPPTVVGSSGDESDGSTPSASKSLTSNPNPSASTPSAGSATPSALRAPKPTVAEPRAILNSGSTGDKVRELQARLAQLQWFPGRIAPTYGPGTTAAVRGFQGKRRLPTTGEVDQKTWDALIRMTETPTRDAMYNIVKAGPAILKQGQQGNRVKDLQARLKQIGWFSEQITGHYGSVTVASVRGFQQKRGIPVTGAVDQTTLDRLYAMTRRPSANELANKPHGNVTGSTAGLDSRCLTGRVMCVSKRTNTLKWVVDGQPKLTLDVRFGSQRNATREGNFQVGWKSRNHVSTIYDTAMPYAMFFSGGQAVHYSADFAARGYNGASHGCINVRNRQAIGWLFDQVRVGDRVVVHR